METTKMIEKIRNHIKDNGIKQRWVAKQAGFTDLELSQYLTGRKRMTADAYIRICDALEVPLETFKPEGRSAS